jgi:hypothetical protein
LGPCHIWNKETAKQKKAAQREMNDYNATHEMDARIEWELEITMRRLNIRRNPRGRKPTWKFTAARGAITRKGKAGGK